MRSLSLTRQVAWLVGLALTASVLSVWLHPKRPAWYRVAGSLDERWRVSAEGLASLLDEGRQVVLVDTRSREELEQGRREGAILLNLEEWGDLMFEQMDALQDASRATVVVFGGDDRAVRFEVAKRLRELLGLDPVLVFEGDWRGLP